MKIRLTTRDDLHLPYYSHSIIEAINTCPRWGIIRYVERKYFQAQYRAMALEAGSAMHDVFAAFRLCQLAYMQGHIELAKREAVRLFPTTSDVVFDWSLKCENENQFRDIALDAAFKSLHHGAFYDDPDDKVRTISNLEISAIRLVDELLVSAERNEVFVSENEELVGVEQSFDFVVDDTFRFIGTMDGLSVYTSRDGEQSIRVDELKTASRLDNAFRDSWRVKSQPVGYMLAARLLTGDSTIENVRLVGIKVKQTRGAEDYLAFDEYRDEGKFLEWHNTICFTHELVDRYRGDAMSSPQFTHSCNRYFRPCGFVDLCGADMEDQRVIYEAMETTPMSPSEENILAKWSKK